LLAIPLVLALIGYGLNLLNRKHDERVADRQAERQAAQHQHELQQATAQRENELEQAVRSETWKQMLLISHQYAAKCYLPLSLAAERQAKNLRDVLAGKSDGRIAFYYVLLCGREMTKTRKKTGGLYFKDLRGETLAAECWRSQREALMGSNEEDPFNLALRAAADHITKVDSYAAFEKKFPEVAPSAAVFTYADSDIQAAWGLFGNWLKNKPAMAEVAKYLEGFSAVLDYESNRPYEHWYDTRPRLVASEQTEKTLREILKAESYSDVDISAYFSSVVRP
jgi:hypothetical protein